MKIKLFILIFFTLPAFLFSESSQKIVGCDYIASLSIVELKKVIENDGFSGIFDDSSSLNYLGCSEFKSDGIGIYFYEREFSNKRLTKRLMLYSSVDGYLGMYALNEKPKYINGSNILFSYPEEYGNKISIKSGHPPESIFLDGEHFDLFK